VPELPEMQALAERVEAEFGGAALKRATPIQFSSLKTFDPAPESLVGRTLGGVSRRGKYLIFDLGGPRMLIHLSQGGRVDFERPVKASRPKHGVVRLVFDNGAGLLVKEFGTERKAGWWILGEEGGDGPLEKLGPEPFSDEFEALVMQSDDGRRVHTLLRDQRTVAGIGRGFSDDILHHARLSPYASLASLDEDERRRLIQASHTILERALEKERERTGGLPNKLQGRFVVHGHSGEPCPRCGETLRRVSYESHEVVYCPACQTGGKILADRRLSRLVR
jgi:formamidopyrimidine-DNA glycosylase